MKQNSNYDIGKPVRSLWYMFLVAFGIIIGVSGIRTADWFAISVALSLIMIGVYGAVKYFKDFKIWISVVIQYFKK